MAQTYTINGVAYSFPDVDDSDWGQNVTDWAGAVSSFLLQRTGGSFTLSAEVDFGSSYGLLVKDLGSKTANPASAGFLQLAKTDVIAWRNNANDGDLNLEKGTDDLLQFNSIDLVNLSATQTLTNKTLTTPVISSISNTGTLTLPTSTDTLVGRDTTDTLTNKTMTSPVINTGISGTAIDNNTSLGSYATKVPTQNAVKSYVDAQLTASDLDFSGDTGGAQSVDLDSESLTIHGDTGIDTVSSDADGSTPKISISIDSTVATLTGSQTLTNKTLTTPIIGSISNTGTLTLPTSTDTLVGRDTTDTLTNKTLTTPVIASLNQASGTNTLTMPAATDTLVGRATTDTLTNKTLTAPVISSISNTGTITLPTSTDTLVGRATTDTLTNKTLTSPKMNEDVAMTTTSTYLNRMDATSSVQTQLDAKAPLASPYFTTYADFDSQGSAPAAPSNTGDVRLYAKDSKFYFHPQGGSATEIGSGGGVGSIDTLFTLQAKSADAPTSGSGNDAVFLGGGSLNNGDITLDTTAADLIGTDKVFKYDATGDSIRNYWYHEETIYPGYAGKNMVLQLQYYTRNGADSESFRFVARDATMPILSVTADGTNTITGTIDATVATAPVVGDKIIFKDSSNNIYYRYITAIVKNSGSDGKTSADNMTYTYSGSDVTATGKVVTGIMTDELDYLPANDITGNEAKIYKKQMLFPDNCTTFQFGFHCLDSDTDIELFYDDIALSANQFLQTSAKLPTQGYTAYWQSNFWVGTAGDGSLDARFDKTKLHAAPGTPAIDDSDLITVSDTGSGASDKTLITAKQRIKIILNGFTNPAGGNAGYIILGANSSYGNTGDEQIATQGPSAGQYTNVTASIILEKDDYVYFKWADVGTLNGGASITLESLANDVVLLNSQDEIFTDWVDYVPGTQAIGDPTWQKARWRRNGCNMQIEAQCTVGTTSGTELQIYLPYDGASRYVIDANSCPQTLRGVCANNSRSDTVFFVASEAGKTYVVFTAMYSGHINSTVKINGNSADLSSGETLAFSCEIPIQGWSSTFNPVLSMPLVDLGNTAEAYKTVGGDVSAFWNVGDGNTYQWDEALLSPVAGSPSLANSSLITIADITSGSNTVTAITAKQDIIIDISITKYQNSASNLGFYWGASNTSLTLSQAAASSQYVTSHWAGKLLAGDYIYAIGQAGPGSSSGRVGGMTLTAQKIMSGNMAHIIKPAVMFLTGEFSSGTNGGGAGAAGSWHNRTVNTIRGESWFLNSLTSEHTFQLQPGHYTIFAQAEFMNTNHTKLKLYDDTNDVDVIIGMSSYVSASAGTGPFPSLNGNFTITQNTDFQLKYRVSNTNSTNDLGQADSFGVTEKYVNIRIEKLK